MEEAQAHFLLWEDLDQDGRSELIAGKRYMAHGGRDPRGERPFDDLSLRVQTGKNGVEPQDDIDKIKRSVHLNPERVKKYFQALVDMWPEEFPVPNPDASEAAAE